MTQSQDDWSAAITERIGVEIKRLRGKRSAQWLADRTIETGYPVSRSTITDIEIGRRKYVTISELCVLAWSLGVPPVVLLYPDLPDGVVEVVPDVEMTSATAVAWFSGEMAPPAPDSENSWGIPTSSEGADSRRLVGLARERQELEVRIGTLTRLVERLRTERRGDLTNGFVDEVVAAQKRINSINHDIHELGGVVHESGAVDTFTRSIDTTEDRDGR